MYGRAGNQTLTLPFSGWTLHQQTAEMVLKLELRPAVMLLDGLKEIVEANRKFASR